MDNLTKFRLAVNSLKANVEYQVSDKVENENDFNNNILWVTGKTESNMAITTTICPHSEITWTAVKAEMDSL